MKSFTMKALAVAVLGFAGVTGAMAAACPTPTFSGNNVTLSPWSGGIKTSTATFAVTTPGLDSTNCKLSLSLGSNGVASPAPANARTFVSYSGDTNDEPRFRARYYIDTTNVKNMSATNIQANIFQYSTTTSPTGLSADEINIGLAGGSSPRVNISAHGSAGYVQSGNIILPTFGQYIVEFDLTRASSCTSGNNFRYWVTDTSGVIVAGTQQNAGATADDTHPAGTLCVNNSGWTGAGSVTMGILSGNTKFRQVANTNADSSAFQLHFDEYDSRRQTYIGK